MLTAFLGMLHNNGPHGCPILIEGGGEALAMRE